MYIKLIDFYLVLLIAEPQSKKKKGVEEPRLLRKEGICYRLTIENPEFLDYAVMFREVNSNKKKKRNQNNLSVLGAKRVLM